MPRTQTPKTPLYRALEAFGRRGRKLDAASIVDHAYLLDAVDGARERASDQTWVLASEVERVIRAAIAELQPAAKRAVAEAVFAVDEGYAGKQVKDRVSIGYNRKHAFTPEQYKDMRAGTIVAVEGALRAAFGIISVSKTAISIAPAESPKGLDLLRLYAFHGQEYAWRMCKLADFEAIVHEMFMRQDPLYKEAREVLDARSDLSDRIFVERIKSDYLYRRIDAQLDTRGVLANAHWPMGRWEDSWGRALSDLHSQTASLLSDEWAVLLAVLESNELWREFLDQPTAWLTLEMSFEIAGLASTLEAVLTHVPEERWSQTRRETVEIAVDRELNIHFLNHDAEQVLQALSRRQSEMTALGLVATRQSAALRAALLGARLQEGDEWPTLVDR